MSRSPNQKLSADDVHVSFGGIRALNGVSLELRRGEILGLIGPNGAGKTTMVNVLSGFQRPSKGTVHIDGRDVSHCTPQQINHIGVSRSFQAARLFRNLTVEQNLVVAGLAIGLNKKQAVGQAREILAWLGFARDPDQLCSSLPYSDERTISIARALASQPSFALLDEPASGMNDAECDQLMHVVARIPGQFGCGVMLIEHNMKVIMGLCERIHVLDGGKSLAEGTPEQVRRDPSVLAAYLGAPASHEGEYKHA